MDMKKMRYSDAPEWSYGGRGNHQIRMSLTLGQVNAAIKKAPSFRLREANQYFKELRGKGEFPRDKADRWEFIKRKDGSTWLVGHTLWVNRCFEIPPAIAKRFEELYELTESW